MYNVCEMDERNEMKITIARKNKTGNKAIRIEFESKEELDTLASMFNHTTLTDTFFTLSGGKLTRDALVALGGNVHNTKEVSIVMMRTPYLRDRIKEETLATTEECFKKLGKEVRLS